MNMNAPKAGTPEKVQKITIHQERVNHIVREKGEAFEEDNQIYINLFNAGQKYFKNTKDQYLVRIRASDSLYVGIMDLEFKRDEFGINHFQNGDTYIGYFKQDVLNDQGIYITKEDQKGGFQIYCGEWKDSKKTYGMQLWLNFAANDPTNVDWTEFNLFLGDFENNKYTNGVFMHYSDKKKKQDFHVYKGAFVYNTGLNKIVKQDKSDQCLFYSKSENRMFYGPMEADHIDKEGKVLLFNADNKIGRAFQCEFENGDKFDKIVKYKVIPKMTNSTSLETFKQYCDYFFVKNEMDDIVEIEFEKLRKFVNSCLVYKRTKEHTEFIKDLEHLLTIVLKHKNKNMKVVETLNNIVIEDNKQEDE